MTAAGLRSALLAPVLALLPVAGTIHAAPPALDLLPGRELRFGTVVVTDAGSRMVSASGAVTNDSIMPMGFASARPASFTIAYDRGSDENRPLSITIEIELSSIPPVSRSGVTGTLSDFDTDLGGGITPLIPGQPVSYTITNCTTRICSTEFQVGARLSITRSTGGASLSLYPPITARIIAVKG